MLRKRSRSIQKDQEHTGQMASSDTNHESYSQSHVLGSNAKSNSIFNAPLLFVGMGPKGLLDSDSVKSPTSPLDFSFLSNLSNPFRTPSSLSNEGQQRSWDCAKVGLSIIDSLEECSKFSGKILQASESKKTSLRPQMITKSPSCKSYVDSPMASKSLPKDFCKIPCAQNGSFLHKDESSVLFEIGETLLENESFCKTVSSSLDSYSPIKNMSVLTGSKFDSNSENFALNHISFSPHFIGKSQNKNSLLPAELNTNRVAAASSDEFMNSLSASEIELSEDYTCVISHGPNPKTTHIFCDCILETHANDFKSNCKKEEEGKGLPIFNLNMLNTHNQYPSDDFLSFCYHCSKKLEEGKDIYIYRGEKSFCSVSCREIEMMIDEELESFNSSVENSPKWKFGGELFET
ncbi:FCS-Like Zinc finger 10 [Cajanus cajan]|uniref:FCS-Like Zinc finger 10 n=1 Tax=Cajanus cajan TaxID=3821 RepID=UPI00098DA09F|nr:FCS-Like Zinc finger 10 [Cajanus cajan]XP_029124975.1 FCS-Like Zinc finger 10 [Cajanus cajan]